MAFNLMIIYPNGSEAHFDMEYYLGTHMPRVENIWRPLGLVHWKVIHFNAPGRQGEDNDDDRGAQGCSSSKCSSSIGNILTFQSEACYQNAMQCAAAKDICSNTARFSDQQPILITGATVALGPLG
ncbi:uncharacterized protein F5Z01DRAFT_30576 [Emericellopsis atlantica]|uniref:EthD domain-containing protein n=1 Tax=Emericellopsis atlantica TaxID=2614577 RepID=A0A9P8CY61_9HYPO|nr:uncharacterized protein F5Z01DRAFT_30576 [Emericellopsis atlantica]KAG9259231.1 hypothetical protein F5Z01DRAFT_30576 [Emericellopsis atlantica]